MTQALRTALLIPVPEAEPAVGHWRRLFDPSATHGVPPHITLVFPFLTSDRCDPAVLEELRAMFGRAAAFDFSLTEIGHFPGILWLTPRPGEPLVQLIQGLIDRFPEAPPYGGAFPAIIPHLTIAHSCDTIAQANITLSVSPLLPVECRAREVWLTRENIDGQWHISERLTLGRTS